jgi:hypothetical protein
MFETRMKGVTNSDVRPHHPTMNVVRVMSLKVDSMQRRQRGPSTLLVRRIKMMPMFCRKTTGRVGPGR